MEKIKKFKTYILALVAIAFIAAIIYFGTWSRTDPSVYKVERTCDFVSVGGVTGAFCSDGTVWSITPFQQVAGNQ